MTIPWHKLLLSAAVGFGALWLLEPKTRQSLQGQFFGFSGPLIQSSPDVATPNCKPAGTSDSYCGTNARYIYSQADLAQGYYACGVTCADARAVYHRKFSPGQYFPDIGLPGQGPVTGGGVGDIINAYGFNPYTQQFGAYAPAAGYGSAPNPYVYNPYTGGWGYSQGYPSQQPYGYNPYPYGYRRTYQGRVVGYSHGHFLYD
jgi:hypothetical protein